MEEFMVRKELGGYYPEDPFKADFFSGLISIKNKKVKKHGNIQHLKNLILKNS